MSKFVLKDAKLLKMSQLLPNTISGFFLMSKFLPKAAWVCQSLDIFKYDGVNFARFHILFSAIDLISNSSIYLLSSAFCYIADITKDLF